MTHVIRIHETGGPEVLKWESLALQAPAAGEVQLRQTAVGLNYIDVYLRTGLYPVDLPAVIGMEAAAVIESVGAGVEHLKTGDRVAYPMVTGAYAQYRNISADKVIKLPTFINDHQAAAMMLKGLTAQYLLRRTYKVQAGDPILVYAAAGGVGSILCPWAKQLGATVIGCVGSEAKADLAKTNGCDYTILYGKENVPQRVRAITGGEGVAVAYDSVGKATFMDSMNSLRPFGMLVTYGNATGKVDAFEPGILAARGSLYVTRPMLGDHIATRELLEDGARDLFDIISGGKVSVAINQTYPLSEVAAAHRDLENRETTGSTVLIP